MTDLIRKSDALYAIAGWDIPSTAIAALPAVTVGPVAIREAAIREAALREAAEEVFSMDWDVPFELHRNILALIHKGAAE